MASVNDLINRVGAIEALAILEAIEKKQRKEKFICYWEAQAQQKKHFPAFTDAVKIFAILGGNRSGKTEEGVFIDVAWALGKKFFEGYPSYEYVKDLPIPDPPNNIWLVGLDFPTLRDVIWREKLRFGRNHPPLLPTDGGVVKKVSDGDFQIFFENGSVITGKSADSGREKFQGASVDLIHIDEECEEAVYDECYQRTADCAGKILLTLTPLVDISSGVRTPWVYDLHEDMVQGRKDIVFVKLNVLENPYVPQEEKDRLVEKWSGHYEEKARLYGDFIQRSGLVYREWSPASHLVDQKKFPKDWRRVVSIDPANTGTTAAVWGAIEPGTNNLYIYREYYEANQTIGNHARNILVRNGGDPVDIWLIDPKWGSQRDGSQHKTGMQLYREAGIPVRLAEVGEDYGLNASREYLTATLDKNARHPKVFFSKDLHNFKFEIEHYTWDFYAKGTMKGLSKDKPTKKNDHLLNAWQYLCALRPKGRRYSGMPSSEAEKKQFVANNSYT